MFYTLKKVTMKEKNNLKEAFFKALKSFVSMLPLLFAVILLIGIFNAYVTKEMLVSFFISNDFVDTITGTLMGATLTGNPMVSYILGGELTDAGVSLYAVSAFILSWVTLGIVQLPAESEAFGLRFTFFKNFLTFIFTILVAFFTALIVDWIIL